MSLFSGVRASQSQQIETPVKQWGSRRTNPKDEYGQRSGSRSRKLHLVEDNPEYKRYQIVSRSRKKINIRREHESGPVIRPRIRPSVISEIDSRQYLKESYGNGSLPLELNLLKKSERKVIVIRDGKEYSKELYLRD